MILELLYYPVKSPRNPTDDEFRKMRVDVVFLERIVADMNALGVDDEDDETSAEDVLSSDQILAHWHAAEREVPPSVAQH